jgi:hypothetical protein
MRQHITQVAAQPWPSGYGEIIAMLDVAPELLAARYSLQFFDGTDNLGDYRAAIVQLPSGRRLGFARHHGDPEPGTEVHADMHDDPQTAIRELLQALELPDRAVTWLRHALVAPEPAGQVH